MKRFAMIAAAALVFSGCAGDEVIVGTIGGGALPLTGIWIGDFTSNAAPGTITQATFQLTQTGSSVTGTLSTNTGRDASVSGTLTGARLQATWTWTDTCGGSASSIADVVLNGMRLTGSYTSNDCLGVTTGGFAVDRQQQP